MLRERLSRIRLLIKNIFKNRMPAKRWLCLALSLVMSVSLWGCSSESSGDTDDIKLSIVTSLFPYYDIVRTVVADLDGISLELAVSPGQDSHSFEPSSADIIEIDNADMFIYNGGSLETWVDTTLESLGNNGQVRMRMMDYVDVLDEKIVEGMDTRLEEEGTDSDDDVDDNDDDSEEDEHIWTSPVNMQILTEKICDVLCQALPEYEEQFRENASDYISRLQTLDEEIREIVDNAETKEIIFADKFPILYFAEEYGLEYYAAFPGCGSDMEPSARTVAFLIDKIKEDDIEAVFYLEQSSHSVADVISEDTGAEVLQFNSCHNITQKQFDDGVTYIDLMEENARKLKRALRSRE